jgi:gas vesicle protein
MSENNKTKGFAVGAAIGAVAGVVAGLLFAPQSGKETRADIKDGAQKVAEKFTKEATKLRDELLELIEKVESNAIETGKELSDKAKKLIVQAKHTRESLNELAASVKKGEADDKDLNEAIKKAKEAREALATYLKK